MGETRTITKWREGKIEQILIRKLLFVKKKKKQKERMKVSSWYFGKQVTCLL